MLLLHQHPNNKDSKPKVVSSHQRVYARTGVDALSHWIVQWEGLPEAFLTADMTLLGPKECTVIVHCEKADLVIECEWDEMFRSLRYHCLHILFKFSKQFSARTENHMPLHLVPSHQCYRSFLITSISSCVAAAEKPPNNQDDIECLLLTTPLMASSADIQARNLSRHPSQAP